MVISIPFSSRENSILNVHVRWAPNCSWLWKISSFFYWFVSKNDPELAERLSKLNLPKRQGWKQMHHAVVFMLSMYTYWFYRQIIKESFDQEQTFWQIIPVKGFILISESVFHIWLRKRKPSAESNRDYHERDHDLPPVICQDFDFSCIQESRSNRLFFLCRICLIATMIRPFFFLIAVLWTRQFKYSHWIFL